MFRYWSFELQRDVKFIATHSAFVAENVEVWEARASAIDATLAATTRFGVADSSVSARRSSSSSSSSSSRAQPAVKSLVAKKGGKKKGKSGGGSAIARALRTKSGQPTEIVHAVRKGILAALGASGVLTTAALFASLMAMNEKRGVRVFFVRLYD